MLAIMEPAEGVAVLAYAKGREKARGKTSGRLEFSQTQELLTRLFHDHPPSSSTP